MKKRKPIRRYSESFEQLLLEAVDEALTSLGARSKTEIYVYLKKRFNLESDKIPERLEEFSDALELIFGGGARLLEVLIMKNLHECLKVNYKYKGPNWLIPDLTFCKYVLLAKLAYNDSEKIGELNILVDISERQKI